MNNRRRPDGIDPVARSRSRRRGLQAIYAWQINGANERDLIAQFERQRAATVAWASTLTQAQLDAAGPMPFLPTVAHLLNLGAAHIWMHCGQIQVLRRKLGKPILF